MKWEGHTKEVYLKNQFEIKYLLEIVTYKRLAQRTQNNQIEANLLSNMKVWQKEERELSMWGSAQLR